MCVLDAGLFFLALPSKHIAAGVVSKERVETENGRSRTKSLLARSVVRSSSGHLTTDGAIASVQQHVLWNLGGSLAQSVSVTSVGNPLHLRTPTKSIVVEREFKKRVNDAGSSFWYGAMLSTLGGDFVPRSVSARFMTKAHLLFTSSSQNTVTASRLELPDR